MQKILVTGSAGYIGSHTCLVLLQADYAVVGLDNLVNSAPQSLQRVQQICGKSMDFVIGDVRDANCLSRLFSDHKIDAVIHFAGLKAVGESVQQPIKYYDNNVVGTLKLLEAMQAANVKRLIFSSSATVYAASGRPRFFESSTLGPSSPYGWSKLNVKQMLLDLAVSDTAWKIALLRYFNPVGAHESGLIGEDPNGVPNNLMPYITQVAVGKLKELAVYGGDYPTPDGTGIRDYIHVMDLAEGHLASLAAIETLQQGATAINLGSGQGSSVLEVITAFEAASGQPIAYRIAPRRDGDISDYFADAKLAMQLLNWRTKRSLADMCGDAWRWQRQNPGGFGS